VHTLVDGLELGDDVEADLGKLVLEQAHEERQQVVKRAADGWMDG
jgi:hypothetical protein